MEFCIYQHWLEKLKFPGICAAALLTFSEVTTALQLLFSGITSLKTENKTEKVRVIQFVLA